VVDLRGRPSKTAADTISGTPFPVKKHRGPPAQAAGHRKDWKKGPLRSVLSFPRGCSPAQLLRGLLAAEDVDFEDQK
jgi:hypothetical protein